MGARLWMAMAAAVVAWGAAAPARALDSVDPCGAETRRHERALGLPDGLLTAISIVESGRFDKASRASLAWPWTVMAEGKGRFLPSKAAAIAEVAALQARGVRNIDVGCMQINLQAHRGAFPDLGSALDPRANVAYAAKFLTDLHDETGSWARAATHYHSRTPHLAAAYRVKLALAWNRMQDGGAQPRLASAPGIIQAPGQAPGQVAAARSAVATTIVYRPLPEAARAAVQRAAERAALKEESAAKRTEAKRAAAAWRAEKLADYHLRKVTANPGAIPARP